MTSPAPSASSAAETALLEAVALGIPSALADLGALVRIPGIAWPAFDQTQLERSADAVADLARGTGVFDEVRVPAANRLGEENKGFGYLTHQLAWERTIIGLRAAASIDAVAAV